VGASASSFDGVSRWTNNADMNSWMEALEQGSLPDSPRETITREELLLETLYLGLRRLEGITFSELQHTLGTDTMARLLKTVESSRFKDYIETDADTIKLTLPGILLLDEIIIELSDCHE
jgi:oxygen-independent coproporphyrinogen-3 oxidase